MALGAGQPHRSSGFGGENLTPPISHWSWFCLEVWVAMGTHAVSGWSQKEQRGWGLGETWLPLAPLL